MVILYPIQVLFDNTFFTSAESMLAVFYDVRGIVDIPKNMLDRVFFGENYKY